MKIVEVLGQADPQYFLHEGCAIFAIALRRLLERGDFYIYADTSDRADKWGRSGYEFTHVVLLVDGRLYDVRGIRALSDLAREFAKNAEQMRLLGRSQNRIFAAALSEVLIANHFTARPLIL